MVFQYLQTNLGKSSFFTLELQKDGYGEFLRLKGGIFYGLPNFLYVFLFRN